MNPYGDPVPLSGWTVPRAVFKRQETSEAPDTQVVTVAALKSHLRITSDEDDDYVLHILRTATGLTERHLSTYLIRRTVTMWMDMLPGMGSDGSRYDSGLVQAPIRNANSGQVRWFELLGNPVYSVTSFEYVDLAGATQVFPADGYIVDISDNDQLGRVMLQLGYIWPTDLRVSKALKITYVVGYAEESEGVPYELKHAVMLVAAALWSNRGDNLDQGVSSNGRGSSGDVLQLGNIRAILDQFRVRRISV